MANELVIGDTIYAITRAYRAGAAHSRAGRHWKGANPHRYGSQCHADWESGYDNDQEGYHHGIDLKSRGTKTVKGPDHGNRDRYRMG